MAKTLDEAHRAGLWNPNHIGEIPHSLSVGMLRFDARWCDDGKTNIDGYPNGERWLEFRAFVVSSTDSRQIAHQTKNSTKLTIDLHEPWIDAIDPALDAIETMIAIQLREEAEQATREAENRAEIARRLREEDDRKLTALAAEFTANHAVQ